MDSFKLFQALPIFKVFFQHFCTKNDAKSSFVNKPLMNLKSHKLVFLKIFHNIGYEMRHQLWIHSSYSRLYQFSKCFFSIFALKIMKSPLLSMLKPLMNLKSHKQCRIALEQHQNNIRIALEATCIMMLNFYPQICVMFSKICTL